MPASVISVSSSCSSSRFFKPLRFSNPTSVILVPTSRNLLSSVHSADLLEPSVRDLFDKIRSRSRFRSLRPWERSLRVRRSAHYGNVNNISKEVVPQHPPKQSVLGRYPSQCRPSASIWKSYPATQNALTAALCFLARFISTASQLKGSATARTRTSREPDAELEPAAKKQGSTKPKEQCDDRRHNAPYGDQHSPALVMTEAEPLQSIGDEKKGRQH